MEKSIKEKFISSAFFMLVATAVVKVISAVYKIPLTAYIGATGRGYFSIAYNLCMPIHALTMGAFPIALTKLISTANAHGNVKQIVALKKASVRLFSIIGIIGMVVIILMSVPYSRLIAASPKSIYTILALAPSVLFSCLGVCHRSFCEGFIDMKPTAVGQLIEAFTKLIFGLLMARLSMSVLLNSYLESGAVLGVKCLSEREALSVIYPLTSAAAMLGTTFGSITSYIFTYIYTKINYGEYISKSISCKKAYNKLLSFSAPLVFATVIQSLSNFLDTSSMQYCLSLCNEEALSVLYNVKDDVYTYVFGIYATALDFKNLVPSIVMALGMTAVPAVSAAYESSAERFSKLLNEILKYTSILSIAGGLVLALFSNEILSLFYSNNNPDIAVNSSRLLFYFGVGILPCCLAITTVYCTQSLGYAKNTIVPFAIGAALRMVLNFILVRNNDINIIGNAASCFAGYLVIVVANLITISRKTKVKINCIDIIFKPISVGAIVFFAVNYIKKHFFITSNTSLNLLIMLIIFVLFYAVLLICFRLLSIKEVRRIKICKKSH